MMSFAYDTLVDRSGDVGLALVVLLLVLLAAHSVLAAYGWRRAWMLLVLIVPLVVVDTAVIVLRVHWLAT
jgi:hypothetical protein